MNGAVHRHFSSAEALRYRTAVDNWVGSDDDEKIFSTMTDWINYVRDFGHFQQLEKIDVDYYETSGISGSQNFSELMELQRLFSLTYYDSAALLQRGLLQPKRTFPLNILRSLGSISDNEAGNSMHTALEKSFVFYNMAERTSRK